MSRRKRPEGWLPRSAFAAKIRAAEFGVDQPYFTGAMKRKVKKQFGYKCFNCGSSTKLHIDHHKPLSAGHALWYGNAVILCRSCNCSKGSKLPQEFYTPRQLSTLRILLAEQKKW